MKHSIVAAVLVILASPASAESIKRSASGDLDGDGKTETVELRMDARGKYTIRVGKVVVRDSVRLADFEEPDLRLEIVDFDKRDKDKEILFYIRSDIDSLLDMEYHYYRYDGGKLSKLWSQSGGDVHLSGNGEIQVSTWDCFWIAREAYRFDRKSKRVAAVPQPFRYVGLEATAHKRFKLWHRIDKKALSGTVTWVEAGDKIEILIQGRAYLVKSAHGIVGWAKEETITSSTDVPAAAG